MVQEHLEALQKKLEFAERSDTVQESAAFRDVAPELERLRAKAVAKAREILMARYVRCRAQPPMTLVTCMCSAPPLIIIYNGPLYVLNTYLNTWRQGGQCVLCGCSNGTCVTVYSLLRT